tara:strand:- start:3002 stop:3673 length:672 start_codon:yes stop_codon:yes gene_type:complete
VATTQEQILQYLRHYTPRAHFEDAIDAIFVGFKKAFDEANALVHTPKERKRAQDRYSYVQENLAALVSSWNAIVTSTAPHGEFYTLMSSGNIKITAAVKPWKKKIRPAQYRLKNSRLNSFLSSPQLELLGRPEGQPVSTGEMLNAIIIPLAPPSHQDQSKPLDIILAVPYFNSCAEYHVWCTLSDFLKGYESMTSAAPDLGWPTIKRKMRDDEDASSSDEAPE